MAKRILDIRGTIDEMVSQEGLQTGGVSTDGNPVCTVIHYFGVTAPTGYLICDGTEYADADYPSLAAQLKALPDHSSFDGSDTNHFRVPDLRGEFLRGSGTNSHTDQGSGADVGVHQDATLSVSLFATQDNRVGINRMPSSNTVIQNFDKIQQTSTTYFQINGTTANVSSGPASGTSRPTNTSVLMCIKAI